MGLLEGGSVKLEAGEEVIVTTRDVLGGPGLIPSQYEALAQDVSAGDIMLLDDGSLELKVVSVSGTEVRCKVIVGGILKDKKGMNLPGVKVTAPSLTENDRSLAIFALGLGVDFLALSFVRKPSDIRALKEVMATAANSALLIAKIEKAEALLEIEGIIREADGIMVARGDLGVELSPEKVPAAQAQLVDMARDFDKPVIVATQMLESMIRSPRPTRAEVMDVSNAVSEGADAVMLSGETAVGKYPVRAVEMMDRVIRETEGYLWPRRVTNGMANPASSKVPPLGVEDAVARATAQLSRDLRVTCIVVFTRTGRSAGKVSAGRPQAPILSAARDPEAGRRTSLFWGVEPVVVDFHRPGPQPRTMPESSLGTPGWRRRATTSWRYADSTRTRNGTSRP